MSTGTKTKVRQHTYVSLADVQPYTTVDVFGVVKFLKPPKQTKGTDLILIVSLIDQTLHKDDEKLKCVFFLKPDKVPKIEVGNVVRFHRLKIGTHQGEKQGGITPGFSWLVFTSLDSEPESSSLNYTYSDEDKERVKELFEWSSDQNHCITDNTCTLSDIAANAYFNLVCQVVSTCVIEEDVCLLMRVWDGTRPIYPVREVDTDKEECIVQSNPELIRRATGYLYDVSVFDDHFLTGSKVKPGMFVKFYNLHAAVYKNLETRDDLTALPTVELCLHKGTTYGRGMLFLSAQSDEAKKLTEKLDSVLPCDNPAPSTSACGNRERMTCISEKNIETNGDGTSGDLPSCGMHDSWMDGDADGDFPLTQKQLCAAGHDGEGKSVERGKNDPEVESNEDQGGSNKGQGQIKGMQLSEDIFSSQFSDEARCMQETAAVILNHPHAKRTRIRDVLQHSVPYKFRLKARVVDYHPAPVSPSQFVSVYCNKCHFISLAIDSVVSSARLCPNCHRSSDQDVELTFMLRLLLHDGSGWLVANLWRAEADKFFKDNTAEEVLSDPESFTEVKDCLVRICPADRDIMDKPWIECCVASYTTASGVNYHIFDTVVA